jgi:Trk K+ transport system NAD-binding subunit
MGYDTVVIGGDGAVGERLACRLADGSAGIVFLDADDRAVERASEAGAEARVADPSKAATFDRENVEEATTAVVASRKDGSNLLVAQLLRLRRTDRVIALVNDPANVEAFAEAGIEPVCATTALSSALAEQRHDREATGERASKPEAVETTDETGTESGENERLRSDGGGDG